MLQVCGKLLNLFCATILPNTFFNCKKEAPLRKWWDDIGKVKCLQVQLEACEGVIMIEKSVMISDPKQIKNECT